MHINIILLEKIHNLGQLGEKISVKPGFWRNYLLPKGKAVLATQENMAKIAERYAELEKAMAEKLAAAKTRADALEGVTVKLTAKAADEGKLYGSLGVRELVEAISQTVGVTLEKSEIHLPNGPIRLIGEHDVEVRLHSEIVVCVKVNVVAESA